MAAPSGSTTPGLSTDDLLSLAGALELGITERTLEHFRNQGLLPKAVRIGQAGKRPLWRHPSESTDQLRALLGFRNRTKDPDILRSALWYRGFAVDTERARASMIAVLESLDRLLREEIARRQPESGDPAERRRDAIGAFVRTAAGRRGDKALPRLTRQSRADRERALALGLRLVIGEPLETENFERDAVVFERFVGVSRGRRGSGGIPPWLSGPATEGVAAFAELGALPGLIAALRAASIEELDHARRIGSIFLDGVVALARLTDALVGRDNAIGISGILAFEGEPSMAAWLTAFMVKGLRSPEMTENIRQVVEGLSANVLPADTRARQLAQMTNEELATAVPELPGLPFAGQLQMRRILDAYSNCPGERG